MPSANNLAALIDPQNDSDNEELADFESSTYQLKRTRSVGLLDKYIAPTKKLIEEDFSHTNHFASDPLNIKPNKSNIKTATSAASGATPRLSSSNLRKLETQDFPVTPSISSNDGGSEMMSSPSTSSITSLNELQAEPEIFQPHDDNDITFEPKNRVDYFSYDWTDREILKSWRYVVDRKKNVDHNSKLENTRLENASWRTWARAKYSLKTVTPESISWKKDIDVSWLYGPKCEPETESDLRNNLQENKAKMAKLQSDDDHVKTSILKSRKISDKINANTDLLKLNIIQSEKHKKKHFVSSPDIEPYDMASRSLSPDMSRRRVSPMRLELNENEAILSQNAQYDQSMMQSLRETIEDSQVSSAIQQNQRHLKQETQSNNQHSNCASNNHSYSSISTVVPELNDSAPNAAMSGVIDEQPGEPSTAKKGLKSSFLALPVSQNDKALKKQRELHFSDVVEQCQIVDYFSNSDEEAEYFGSKNSDNSESSEDEGVVLSVKSNSKKFSTKKTDDQYPKIIEKLGATTLRFRNEEESSDESDFESEDEENYKWLLNNMQQNETMSHNVNTNRGYEYYYDYNSVYAPEEVTELEDVPEELGIYNEEVEDTPMEFEPSKCYDTTEMKNVSISLSKKPSSVNNLSSNFELTPSASIAIKDKAKVSSRASFDVDSGSESGSESEDDFFTFGKR